MSADRLRELCAELLEALEVQLDDLRFDNRLCKRARALLAEAQPQPVEPTDEELKLLVAEYRHLSAVQFARAVLARWGRPAPEPVSVAGDAAWREFIEAVQHAQHVAMREGESPRFDLVATAFALWRSAAPEPVSVAERPWEREGWCDAEGRCWLFGKVEGDWRLMSATSSGLPSLKYCFSHSLPHWALPVPQEQADD